MKKFLIVVLVTFGVMGGLCYLGYKHQDEIYVYYQYNVKKVRDNITITKNKYFKDVDYKYVQNTNDFLAKDKKHLINIFYTIVNSGVDNFTFYCDDSYEKCIDDTILLVRNDDILSNINNFVHPFNSFENISTSYDKYGKVVVTVERVYSNQDIAKLETKVDSIIKNNITSKMSTKQKITVIHDYIINHGNYVTDSIRKKNPDKKYNKANDILLDGYGLCSSYADAMALFLNKLNVNNYKIASTSHIWNLVYINKKWVHLDVTWDDPVTRDGSDRLEKTFLLISNKELKNLNVKKHKYDKNVYIEAK